MNRLGLILIIAGSIGFLTSMYAVAVIPVSMIAIPAFSLIVSGLILAFGMVNLR